MTDGRRRAILIMGALAAVAVIVAGVLVLWPEGDKPDAAPVTPKFNNGPSSSQVVDNFLKLASAGNAAEAAALTDNPAAAQAALTALGKNTSPAVVQFARKGSADATPNAGAIKVPISGTLKLNADNTWQSSLDLVRNGDKWIVKWTPAVIHPKLAEGQSIAVIGQVGQSGQVAVVGEDGKPLMMWEASGAKAIDPKISPLLLRALTGGSQPGATDSRHISIIDAAGKEVGEPLYGQKAVATATEPVKSTVNGAIAIAAQNAVAKAATQPTMLVAIRPSTGGILAVAQNDAAGTSPTALNGLYQPGSSFKIVSAAAAIQQAGKSVDSDVTCPGSATISGRTIRNADFDIPGTTKFRTAFARSCNTTFGEIAAGLPADSLKRAADQFGLNADFTIPGITTELGKVQDAASGPQRVEDSIGQGNIQASPLGMALVAATVAARKAVTPQLRKDVKTEVTAGYTAPPAAVLAQLQTMMGDVVAGGTAQSLKKFAGLRGKTGTAETTNNGAEANGWFVGYRGDVAFAVLVKDGNSSKPALDVSAAFLSGF